MSVGFSNLCILSEKDIFSSEKKTGTALVLMRADILAAPSGFAFLWNCIINEDRVL
ncbi:hypothetical protein GCM10007972_16050 [Iodidimonas muriae]|uniref:Uncharacterized protein n=1 Tax=Iodidimonas muriae TaxID=261467 RepID=A0ABQ2LD71_9PROT|nr:hypothetical protein JCM17843_22400 [Kordiimonadales bacterium JCM 17843]GGO11848.1 hypothetical protein GCM10007972_16050 [Iodidimonas muriae]